MKPVPILIFILIGLSLTGCAPSLVHYKAMGEAQKLDSAASVIANATVQINAPAEIVWTCLMDVQAWPDWNPKVKSVQASGPLALGSKFTWGASFPRIESEVVYIRNEGEIVWVGRMLHVKAIHKWNLAVQDNTTVVTTEESLDGKMLSLFFGKKKLRSDLEAWLKYLKNQAEAQYLGARENAAFVSRPPRGL